MFGGFFVPTLFCFGFFLLFVCLLFVCLVVWFFVCLGLWGFLYVFFVCCGVLVFCFLRGFSWGFLFVFRNYGKCQCILLKFESKEMTFKAKQPGDMTGPLTSKLVSGKENSTHYCLKRK